jgi:hypothetical protein
MIMSRAARGPRPVHPGAAIGFGAVQGLALCLLTLVCACERTKGAVTTSAKTPVARTAPEPPPPPPPATPEELRRRVEWLYNKTLPKHGSFTAMAANEGSQKTALQRYQMELKVADAAGRVPDEPNASGLERELREMLERLRIPGASVRAEVRPPARKALPATLPDGTPIELTPDALRGIVDFEITLPGAPESLDWLLAALRRVRRLVVPTSAKRSAGVLRVRGEAYWFFQDVVPPRVDVRPPALDQALARAGLPSDVSAGGAGAVEQMRKIAAWYEDMRAQFPAYQRVLALVRESVPFRERLSFLRDRAGAQASLTEASLMAQGARRN